MAENYIATIDCGSSNVRCIIFDMDTGRQVSAASRDWYVPQNNQIKGAYDFNSERNWPLVCECTRKALSGLDPRNVTAVTASGFRHGIFCMDKAGKDVVYGCFNMDSRTEISYIREHGLAEKIYRTGGDWPSLHGLPRLMWIKQHDPAAFDRIGKFMLVSDWIVYMLCGEIATEPANASSTLLMDLKQRAWSKELMRDCALPEEILPEVVDAGTVLGKISAATAEQTGFAAGTSVVVGVADTQAGLLGVGAVGMNASAIVGGTYWLDCQITDTPFIDPELCTRTSCHSEKDQWIFEGVGFYVGLAVRWFRDAFGEEEKLAARRYGLDPYELLDKLAAAVPAGSYGLQVLFSGVADQKNWKMCAPSFVGWDILDPAKSNKGVFFRAILENACYQAHGEYGNIRRITADKRIPEKIILCGGAARSRVWAQILSDVTGRPVITPVEKEGTAIGAAMYAAIGKGLFRNSAEAHEAIVKQEEAFAPDLEKHALYMDEYARWRRLYELNLRFVDEGLVKPMWQANSTITETQRQNPWRLK